MSVGKIQSSFLSCLQDGEYTEICKMALYLHCLAPTTVDCERGFSLMNSVKTSCRNRLKGDMVSALMAIANHDSSLATFPFARLN